MLREKLNADLINKAYWGTKEERLYLSEKDFTVFLVCYFRHYLKYSFAPFHFLMFDDLERLLSGDIRELVWLGFRESAKTSLAKTFLMWLILFKKKKYINVDSFDKTNAERILFDLRTELSTNDRIKADFMRDSKGKTVPLIARSFNPSEVSQTAKNDFVTTTGIRVEAFSTRQAVRGRLHIQDRPDFLLLDDFENSETLKSRAYADEVIAHIDEFAYGLDATCPILYLGNYITEAGVIQTILDRAKNDKRVLVRIVNLLDESGEPTWPQKYALTDDSAKKERKISIEDLRRKARSNEIFMREMMNTPINPETQAFFSHWFKKVSMKEAVENAVERYATIDTALSKGSKSDSTGLIKNYVDKEGHWNLLAKRLRISPTQLVDLIFELHADGFEIGIERTAYTDAIKPFFEAECQRRRVWPVIHELKHGGTMKESRIRGLVGPYEQGHISHIDGECTVLEEELVRFPNSAHDDVSDAAAYQLHMVQLPSNSSGSSKYSFYGQKTGKSDIDEALGLANQPIARLPYQMS